jgi:hypothetical protein
MISAAAKTHKNIISKIAGVYLLTKTDIIIIRDIIASAIVIPKNAAVNIN